MKRSRSWLSDGVIPGVFVGSIATVPFLYRERLPEEIARHWDLAGNPNGWSPFAGLVVVVTAIAVVVWGTLIGAKLWGTSSAAMTATVHAVLGILVGAMGNIVWANLDTVPGASAKSNGVGPLLLVLGGGLVAGIIGWFASDEDSGIGAKASSESLPVVGLDADERAVWVSGTQSRTFLLIAAVMVAVAVVLASYLSILFILIAILMGFFSTSSVSVSRRGVAIGIGPTGWPSRLVPISEIARAESIEIEPLAFGGWGLRSRGLGDNRTAALIVRRGSGIRVVRPNRADIVVSVDDPDDGIGLINALVTAGLQA